MPWSKQSELLAAFRSLPLEEQLRQAKVYFLRKVLPDPVTDCWNWTGCKKEGYGLCHWANVRGLTLFAHRLAAMVYFGVIDPGKEVCHRCDNPGCVNPSHLFIGTHQDNIQDMTIKGRASKRPGEAAPTAKLSEADVREIRRLHAEGISPKALAQQYRHKGITKSGVNKVVGRASWMHIE